MADPGYTENQYGSASATINKYHIGNLERVPFVYKSLVGLSQQINQISQINFIRISHINSHHDLI